MALMSGCVSMNNIEAAPAPVETRSADELIADLTEFKDPSELTLKAGATAEDFGRWVVDLENKWRRASCVNDQEVVHGAVDTHTEGDVFRGDLTTANADVFIAAEFGGDWKNNELAVKWHDGMAEVNSGTLDKCIQNQDDLITNDEFISAADAGVDSDGSRLIEVIRNTTSNDTTTRGLGMWKYTYTVSEANGNTLITYIAATSA